MRNRDVDLSCCPNSSPFPTRGSVPQSGPYASASLLMRMRSMTARRVRVRVRSAGLRGWGWGWGGGGGVNRRGRGIGERECWFRSKLLLVRTAVLDESVL